MEEAPKSDDKPQAPANPDPSGSGPATDPTTVTITQDRLNKLMAKEKHVGKEAAQRELAEQFGMPVEDAKKLLGEYKAKQDAEKSEAQRAKEAAEAARAEAEQLKAQAQADRHVLKVEKQLLAVGAPVARIERLARLVDASVGADDDAISTAVEQVKADFPELFAGSTNGKTHPVSSDPQGATPPKKPSSIDDAEEGKRLAEMFNKTGRVSF